MAVVALPRPSDGGAMRRDASVTRVGTRYVGEFPDGWLLQLTRVRSSRGEVKGTLSVSKGDEQAYRGTFNVSSLTTRKTTANYLQHQTNGYQGWAHVLEFFCQRVQLLEEEGPPELVIGNLPKRERIDYVLDPMIPEGTPAMIYGPPEAGKSTLAVAVGFSVQTGISCVRGWHVPRARNVLVLDWETGQREWNDRLHAVANGMNFNHCPEIHYRRVHEHRLADLVEPISAQVARDDIGLVIIDSHVPAEGGRSEGGSAEDATLRFYAAVSALETTTLIIGAVSKEGRESKQARPYGSIFTEYECRSIWELRPQTQPQEYPNAREVGLFHYKFNEGPKSKAAGVRIAFGGDCTMLELCDVPAEYEARTGSIGSRIRRLLGRTGAMTPEEIVSELDGVELRDVRRELSRGKQKGDLNKLPDGRIVLIQQGASQ